MKQKNIYRYAFACWAVALLVFMPVSAAAASAESWPMSRHDAAQTGYTTSLAPTAVPVQLWNFTLEIGSFSAPAVPVVADGSVYVSAGDLYCFNAETGAKQWSFPLGNDVSFAPAIGSDRVYAGSADGYVYCVDAASGALVWNSSVGDSAASPITLSDGSVYLVTWSGNVYCLNAVDGTELWSFSSGSSALDSLPAVSSGLVYFGTGDNVVCLDASNGEKVWAFTAGGSVSSPSVAGGFVYVGSADGNAYCLRAQDGVKMWNYTAEYNSDGPSHGYEWGNRVSGIAVAGGYIYFGSSNFQVYCLDVIDGVKVWNFTTNAGVYAAPSVANGLVLVGSYDGNLYCLNATQGERQWSYPVGVYSPVNAAGSAGSPAIADGTVYVVGNGILYALSKPSIAGFVLFPFILLAVAFVVLCLILALVIVRRRWLTSMI